MDGRRLEELERKRFEVGLTDEEADELGRLLAGAAGEPYASADDRPHPDEVAWEREVEVKRREERGEPLAVDVTEEPDGDHKPEEKRAVGRERQPVPPAASGYVPPAGSSEPTG